MAKTKSEIAEASSEAEFNPASEVVAAPAEKTVEVRLLRNYVPANAETVPDAPGVFVKHLAGEILSLPRNEAKRAIELKIAEITADLV